MIGLMVVLLMSFWEGEYGFSTLGVSWFYSRECMLNSTAKLTVNTPEFQPRDLRSFPGRGEYDFL